MTDPIEVAEFADITAPADLPGAERLLSLLADDEAEADAIDASAQAAIDAIAKRRDSIKAKAEKRAAWVRVLLEEYAKTHRSEIVRGGKKSRELLAGTIGFRSSGEKVVVTDLAAVLAWAQDKHMELLDLAPKLDKKALDRLVLSTGEIPPGVDVTPASETIHIKTHPLPTFNASKQEVLP